MIQILLAGSMLAALAFLAAVTTGAVVGALRSGGRRDEAIGDYDALAASRFTIPVSLIVPLGGSTAALAERAIAALLQLDYPEIELIVVAEADGGLESLKAAWALSPHEFFYRQSLPTRPLRRICRSTREPRLFLVEKEPGGRADAINCGMNIARYRYVAVIDPGVRVDAGALLRAMAAPLRDPARVVAASSHVEVMTDPFETLASVRTLMESRVLWDGIRNGIGPESRVVVWRRDAILQHGGFSSAAIDPELDLMANLHSSAAEGDASGPAVVRTAAVFGATDAPVSRAASYGATLQALRILRGAPSTTAFRWMFVTRVLTPVCQAWVLAGTGIAVASGWLPWRDVVLALGALCFGQGLVSTAALLVRGAAPGAPDERGLKRLLLLAPLELILRGPAAGAARITGTAEFSSSAARH